MSDTPEHQITPVTITGGEPLGRPPTSTEEMCGTLYTRRTYDTTWETTRHISRWMPTQDQLAAIAKHGILLSVVGGHPPVMLYTASEIDVPEPDSTL